MAWERRSGGGHIGGAVCPSRHCGGEVCAGFPSFGTERRGAPVTGFNRVDDKQIKIRSGIYHPDVVVVLDESLVALVDVAEGLKPDGILLVNTTKSLEDLKKVIKFEGKIATVDATGIAWKELGVPITNTTMLGALRQADGGREIRIPGRTRSRSASAGSPRRTSRPPRAPTIRSNSSIETE